MRRRPATATATIPTLVFALACASGCTQAARTGAPSAAQAAPGTVAAPGTPGAPLIVPNLWDTQAAIDAWIKSGRWETEVASVMAQTGAWMEERAKAVAKPAIVLDVDETALSNWPALRANRWARIADGPCDLEHGPCGLREWQKSGKAQAIRPVLALARRARELGVAVFFVVTRPPELMEATRRNLREQGYEFTEVIGPPKGVKYPSSADFKAGARRDLVNKGWTIVAVVGDQETDLTGGSGERFYKLPNPVYRIR
ncbi:MAG: HAD family acid phosphatase [Alphaproteobacteria bacterium]